MKKIHLIVFVLFLLVSCISILPLLRKAYFSMHDDTQPTRIFLMHSALGDRQIPVRRVEHLGYGYGYPIFNYYAPLPYYAGSAFYELGFDAIDSAKIVFALSTVGAGITMYVLLLKYFGAQAAMIGGIVYVFFPYHAINIYVRGALSEQFGYMIVPLVIFYFLNIIYEKKKTMSSILLGISGALLILSHNLSALMLGVVLFPFFLYVILSHKKFALLKYFF